MQILSSMWVGKEVLLNRGIMLDCGQYISGYNNEINY